MKWGFTGAQRGAPEDVILQHLETLALTSDDRIITGGCIGVDSQIFWLVREHYPTVPQTVVIPSNFIKVDQSILWRADHVIRMPKGTTYRERNERLVEESDSITAFWTGAIRSGTNMTKNIAKRAGKLRMIIKI